MFALPKLSPIVLAVAPVYVPEKVKVPSVAVKFASVPPKEIPEIVEAAKSAIATEPSGKSTEPLLTTSPKAAVKAPLTFNAAPIVEEAEENKLVVVAPALKVCAAVQVAAKAVSKDRVPDVVIVPPVIPLLVATEVTVPEVAPTQTPLTAKHPA